MGKVVLDTSVVLGMLNPEDSLHLAASDAVLMREYQEFVIPTMVLAEVLVGASRMGGGLAEKIEEAIDDFASEIFPADLEVAQAAVEILLRRPSLQAPDAFVLATGRILDAEVLTADKAWRGEPGHVTVIEPK